MKLVNIFKQNCFPNLMSRGMKLNAASQNHFFVNEV